MVVTLVILVTGGCVGRAPLLSAPFDVSVESASGTAAGCINDGVGEACHAIVLFLNNSMAKAQFENKLYFWNAFNSGAAMAGFVKSAEPALVVAGETERLTLEIETFDPEPITGLRYLGGASLQPTQVDLPHYELQKANSTEPRN